MKLLKNNFIYISLLITLNNFPSIETQGRNPQDEDDFFTKNKKYIQKHPIKSAAYGTALLIPTISLYFMTKKFFESEITLSMLANSVHKKNVEIVDWGKKFIGGYGMRILAFSTIAGFGTYSIAFVIKKTFFNNTDSIDEQIKKILDGSELLKEIQYEFNQISSGFQSALDSIQDLANEIQLPIAAFNKKFGITNKNIAENGQIEPININKNIAEKGQIEKIKISVDTLNEQYTNLEKHFPIIYHIGSNENEIKKNLQELNDKRKNLIFNNLAIFQSKLIEHKKNILKQMLTLSEIAAKMYTNKSEINKNLELYKTILDLKDKLSSYNTKNDENIEKIQRQIVIMKNLIASSNHTIEDQQSKNHENFKLFKVDYNNIEHFIPLLFENTLLAEESIAKIFDEKTIITEYVEHTAKDDTLLKELSKLKQNHNDNDTTEDFEEYLKVIPQNQDLQVNEENKNINLIENEPGRHKKIGFGKQPDINLDLPIIKPQIQKKQNGQNLTPFAPSNDNSQIHQEEIIQAPINKIEGEKHPFYIQNTFFSIFRKLFPNPGDKQKEKLNKLLATQIKNKKEKLYEKKINDFIQDQKDFIKENIEKKNKSKATLERAKFTIINGKIQIEHLEFENKLTQSFPNNQLIAENDTREKEAILQDVQNKFIEAYNTQLYNKSMAYAKEQASEGALNIFEGSAIFIMGMTRLGAAATNVITKKATAGIRSFCQMFGMCKKRKEKAKIKIIETNLKEKNTVSIIKNIIENDQQKKDQQINILQDKNDDNDDEPNLFAN